MLSDPEYRKLEQGIDLMFGRHFAIETMPILENITIDWTQLRTDTTEFQ